MPELGINYDIQNNNNNNNHILINISPYIQ